MHYYWNGLYSAWGWVLWFGIIVLSLAIFGNWRYTYRAHRRFDDLHSGKGELDVLNEQYARGDIDREAYLRTKFQISLRRGEAQRKGA